jgi:hypothetical protein
VKPSVSDPMNGNKDDLLWYTNFISDTKGTVFIRKRFNVVDLLRQMGGIIGALRLLSFCFVQLFAYRKHELKIIKNLDENEEQEKPWVPLPT